MTNTRIDYLYRDGDNYKTSSSEVFAGVITPEQMKRLIKALDADKGGEIGAFIPGLVGLKDLQSQFGSDTGTAAMWDPGRDHPFHEITDVDPTDEAVTQARSIEAFICNCETTVWHPDYLPDVYDAMKMAWDEAHPESADSAPNL